MKDNDYMFWQPSEMLQPLCRPALFSTEVGLVVRCVRPVNPYGASAGTFAAYYPQCLALASASRFRIGSAKVQQSSPTRSFVQYFQQRPRHFKKRMRQNARSKVGPRHTLESKNGTPSMARLCPYTRLNCLRFVRHSFAEAIS